MNTAANNISEQNKRDAWRHKLRSNSVLVWADQLSAVSQYTQILDTSPSTSTLEIERGIVKIQPSGRYIGHQFVPHVKAGFTFQEISVLLKAKIVEFEAQYGKIELSDSELNQLRQLVYGYNRSFMSADLSDRKGLLHIEQSAEVLYYLLAKSVTLISHINGVCSLVFANSGNTEKDYCTIFTEEQISLLAKVNSSIQ